MLQNASLMLSRRREVDIEGHGHRGGKAGRGGAASGFGGDFWWTIEGRGLAMLSFQPIAALGRGQSIS